MSVGSPSYPMSLDGEECRVPISPGELAHDQPYPRQPCLHRLNLVAASPTSEVVTSTSSPRPHPQRCSPPPLHRAPNCGGATDDGDAPISSRRCSCKMLPSATDVDDIIVAIFGAVLQQGGVGDASDSCLTLLPKANDVATEGGRRCYRWYPVMLLTAGIAAARGCR
jgi:hypothetical protein